MRISEAGHELEGRTFDEWAADLARSPRKQGELGARGRDVSAGCRHCADGRCPAPTDQLPGHQAFLLPYPPSPDAAGIAIAAMYSAAPALDRIRQESEDALVAAYCAREAEVAAASAGSTGSADDG